MKKRLFLIILSVILVMVISENLNVINVNADEDIPVEIASETDAYLIKSEEPITYELEDVADSIDEESEVILEEDTTLNEDDSLEENNVYNVIYVDGKTNPNNPTTYQKSSVNVLLENPSWKGHTFKGWYYDSDFTRRATMIKAGSTGDKTFYAQWTVNTYTVRFAGNNSTSGTMKDMSCEYGSTYILNNNAFKKKGYTFTGWNTKANGSGKAYVDQDEIKNLNSNSGVVITLYAQWKPNSYNIVFKGYRAESGSMKSVTYEYGNSYTLPANKFKKRGYTFTGWNTKSDGSGRKFKDCDSVCNLTAVDGNTLTLYTQWEKTQYKIVYNLDGGINNSKNPTSYNITTNTITLKDASKKGYIFEGWYSDSGFTNKVTTIPKGSVKRITLYAKWKPITYIVRFDGKSENGHMDDIVCVYGKRYAIPDNKFSYDGMEFVAWATDPTSTPYDYDHVSSIYNLGTKDGEIVILYACLQRKHEGVSVPDVPNPWMP